MIGFSERSVMMNKEDRIFKAIDEDGIEMEYEILLIKCVDAKPIIWYTDGTSDEDGRRNIFVSTYTLGDNGFELNPIEDDSEMEKYADIFDHDYIVDDEYDEGSSN